MGGIYYTFCMATSVGVGFASIPFYFANTDPGMAVLDKETAYTA
jgi:hypothetical protein